MASSGLGASGNSLDFTSITKSSQKARPKFFLDERYKNKNTIYINYQKLSKVRYEDKLNFVAKLINKPENDVNAILIFLNLLRYRPESPHVQQNAVGNMNVVTFDRLKRKITINSDFEIKYILTDTVSLILTSNKKIDPNSGANIYSSMKNKFEKFDNLVIEKNTNGLTSIDNDFYLTYITNLNAQLIRFLQNNSSIFIIYVDKKLQFKHCMTNLKELHKYDFTPVFFMLAIVLDKKLFLEIVDSDLTDSDYPYIVYAFKNDKNVIVFQIGKSFTTSQNGFSIEFSQNSAHLQWDINNFSVVDSHAIKKINRRLFENDNTNWDNLMVGFVFDNTSLTKETFVVNENFFRENTNIIAFYLYKNFNNVRNNALLTGIVKFFQMLIAKKSNLDILIGLVTNLNYELPLIYKYLVRGVKKLSSNQIILFSLKSQWEFSSIGDNFYIINNGHLMITQENNSMVKFSGDLIYKTELKPEMFLFSEYLLPITRLYVSNYKTNDAFKFNESFMQNITKPTIIILRIGSKSRFFLNKILHTLDQMISKIPEENKIAFAFIAIVPEPIVFNKQFQLSYKMEIRKTITLTNTILVILSNNSLIKEDVTNVNFTIKYNASSLIYDNTKRQTILSKDAEWNYVTKNADHLIITDSEKYLLNTSILDYTEGMPNNDNNDDDSININNFKINTKFIEKNSQHFIFVMYTITKNYNYYKLFVEAIEKILQDGKFGETEILILVRVNNLDPIYPANKNLKIQILNSNNDENNKSIFICYFISNLWFVLDQPNIKNFILNGYVRLNGEYDKLLNLSDYTETPDEDIFEKSLLDKPDFLFISNTNTKTKYIYYPNYFQKYGFSLFLYSQVTKNDNVYYLHKMVNTLEQIFNDKFAEHKTDLSAIIVLKYEFDKSILFNFFIPPTLNVKIELVKLQNSFYVVALLNQNLKTVIQNGVLNIFSDGNDVDVLHVLLDISTDNIQKTGNEWTEINYNAPELFPGIGQNTIYSSIKQNSGS